MLAPAVGRTHHHRTNVCIGTVVTPPTRMSILLALPGPDVDTDHAVVIAAAAMMIAMVTLLRMYSPPPDWKQPIGIADERTLPKGGRHLCDVYHRAS
jgi:hypothetical protein